MIEDLKRQLNGQIEKIPGLKKLNHKDKDFKQWKMKTKSILQKYPFATVNPAIPYLIDKFNKLRFWVERFSLPGEGPGMMSRGRTSSVNTIDLERYNKDLETAEDILKGIVEELQDPNFYPQLEEDNPEIGFRKPG